MDPDSLKKLQQHIPFIRGTTEEEIAARFITFLDRQSPPHLTCSFYLVKCTTQEVREKDLAEFLVDKIVRYVLKQKDITAAGTNPDLHAKNVRKARAKFIHGRDTREVGELLLFLLLESRGIVQIVSKIALKTNREMYFHGVDALHIQVTENMILHLGSSKMMSEFGDGVKESLSEMEEHERNSAQQNIEIDLISTYIDDSKFAPFTKQIESVLDPYSPDRHMFAKEFSMLICSNFEFLKKPYANSIGQSLEKFLTEQFESQHVGLLSKINKDLPSFPLVNSKPTHFYIVPFGDVAAFCQMFSEVLKS